MDATWGQVMQVTPSVTVRLAGDTHNTPIVLTNAIDLHVGDKVALILIGTGWWIAGTIGVETSAVLGNIMSPQAWDLATSDVLTTVIAGDWPVDVGRNRRIRAALHLDRGSYGTVAGDVFTLGIRVNGTVVETSPVPITTSGAYLSPGVFVHQIYTEEPASITIGAQVQRTTGSGDMQFRGKLIVDDFGPV